MTYDQFTTLYTPHLSRLPKPCTTESAMTKLWQISEKLVENNKKYNLTAITEPEAVVEKHIVDSLLPLSLLVDQGILTPDLTLPDNKRLRLIDIGAGAGFPSLPFAAVFSSDTTRILAVDATAKKVRHITETAAFCGISHMSAEAGRAEELSQGKLRESFTIATARAVAELRILLELTAPFVAVGGYVVALKGSHGADEIEDAKKIAPLLGLGEPQVTEYALPSGDGRTLILYPKEKPTPAGYPRPYGKIKNDK